MSRVRANDYDDKKQVILCRAAGLFGERGFEATTMNEVAQACGTSKSHLYHYFPRKEALLFAIVDEHIDGLLEMLDPIVAAAGSGEERFRCFVSAFVEQSAASRYEHLVLMNDLKFLPRQQREAIQSREVRLIGMLVSLMQDVNPSLMQPEQVRTPYALMLFGTMIWTFTWYDAAGAVPPVELADRLADVFLEGFKHAAGRPTPVSQAMSTEQAG